MSGGDRLFVYGTLRPGFGGAMARRLGAGARHIGRGWAKGRLYRVADYPGFVPGGEGRVTGDLFALPDTDLLAALDDFEQCSDAFPEPREYRREKVTVEGAEGPVLAWTYVYAWPVETLPLIESGDFLG